jgi:phosphohistidine phosphatase SixA
MKSIVALFFALACFSPAAYTGDFLDIDDVPDFVVKPITPSIVRQLRKGGYVLYMRHANSDTTRPDQLPNVDLNDCSTQRPLTEEGRLIAKKIGQRIRKAGIPLGEIYSSPMCRARETAISAYGPNIIVNSLLMYTSNMTDKEKAPVLEATRELIARPVQGNVNRVVVAHAQNLMDIMGYLPKPEGVVVIFKPSGDKHFKYIASVTPEQWKNVPKPQAE